MTPNQQLIAELRDFENQVIHPRDKSLRLRAAAMIESMQLRGSAAPIVVKEDPIKTQSIETQIAFIDSQFSRQFCYFEHDNSHGDSCVVCGKLFPF